MDGERFRAMLNEMLPPDVVEEAAGRLGVVERERKLDPVVPVWALILAGGAEECGRLLSALRAPRKGDGEKRVARSAFCQWFDAQSIASSEHMFAARMAARETPLRRWASLASAIRHLSLDTKWRRNPIVMDRVNGRVAAPGRPRRSTAAAATAAASAT